jgi:peptidoglycan-associated lipoprotein
MMRHPMRRAAGASAVALGLVALGACSHHPPPAATPQPVAVAPTPPPPPPPVPKAAMVTPVVDDAALRRASEAARNILGAMTFFAFDQAILTDEDRSTLDAKIPILQSNPMLRIRINGNCDDRGSDEYNLALGQRRAAIAKRYLTDHGVDASRIEIISFGKERPIAQGDDEAAWARNRNDQFVIIAGPEELHSGM